MSADKIEVIFAFSFDKERRWKARSIAMESRGDIQKFQNFVKEEFQLLSLDSVSVYHPNFQEFIEVEKTQDLVLSSKYLLHCQPKGNLKQRIIFLMLFAPLSFQKNSQRKNIGCGLS